MYQQYTFKHDDVVTLKPYREIKDFFNGNFYFFPIVFIMTFHKFRASIIFYSIHLVNLFFNTLPKQGYTRI